MSSLGKLVFKPQGRLIKTLGQDLIDNEIIAIIELIKNSFDAEATIVVLTFDVINKTIEIKDNGVGMTIEDIETKWMVPATDDKDRTQIRTKKYGRPLLGQKGIGRFAAARIGDILEYTSQPEKSNYLIKMTFDWNSFDNRALNKIDIEYFQEKPEHPDDHGLTLKIGELLNKNISDLARDVHKALEKLVTHIGEREDDFFIHIEVLGNKKLAEKISGRILPSIIVEHYFYRIYGDIYKEGFYKFMLEIPETEDQEIEGFFEDDITRSKDQQLYDCGPFKIDIKIWDRDPEAIRTLKEILKKETLTEVKELLDESSGLNIHRDGFRIYPYGEPGHDWLDLNARRVQNPSLRLSINQISGNVFITREKNPSLKDRSDRQGIMQSRRLETFKNRIIDAINIIERKRFLHRQRKIKEKKEKEKEIDIFEKFYLADLKNYVKNNDDIKKDEITALIKGYDENITRTLDIIKDQLMIYRKLSVMGAFADEAIHNVKPHIGSIRSNSRSILRFLNSIDQEISELEQKKEYLRLIIESNDEIKRHFENLEPLSGSKKSLEKSTFHIGQVCRDTFASILRFTRTKYKIKKKVEINLDIKGEDVKIFELKGNWNVIFQNLIDNSIYWCNLHTDKIEMKLEINKFEDYLVLSFNDNGPGIDPEFEELIFLPYFSTKRDGVGLGLSIVKEIVEDLNGTIKTNYNENGAEFVINIPDKLEV